MVRFNADVDDESAKRLRHALVDAGITFAEWLRRQIDAYLKAHEHEAKGQRSSKRVSQEEAVERLIGLGRRKLVLDTDLTPRKPRGGKGKEGK